MVDLIEGAQDAADELGAVLDSDRAASDSTEEAIDTAVEYSPTNLGNTLLGFDSPLSKAAGSQEARAETQETTEQTVQTGTSAISFAIRNQRLVLGAAVVVGALYFSAPLLELADTLAEGGD
jgi:hypothetical protein